jgi:hypothetical protein
MKNPKIHSLLASTALLALIITACQHFSAPSEPKAAFATVSIGSDLTKSDLCAAIPKEDIEAVLGHKLVNAPQRFEYYDTAGSSGCSYDAGKDSQGGAHFGYVALTPADAYSHQPLYKNTAVSGLGQEAYFNNGADARQLWVKVNPNSAFVVGFGDEPNEAGALAIARLLIAAIRPTP